MRLVLVSSLIMLIASCSTQKRMAYHEKGFYKNGGTFKCEPVKETVYDTIIKDGDTLYVPKDSIVYKPSIKYVPRYVYKYLYKTIKVQEKEQTKRNRDDNKAETKQVISNNKKDTKINRQNQRAETKQHKQTEKTKRSKWWVFLLIGIGIGLVLKSAVKFFLNKLKTILW